MRNALLACLAFYAVGCADAPDDAVPESSLDQATTVCGVGSVVKGIDVSYYQGTIDWAKVKNAGVQFAVIRVSDGSYLDTKFATNWANAKSAGVLRGAYQFFRPGQDAIAQADILLNKMGPLGPNDLPPTLDVEAADGLGSATVAAHVKQWVNYVTSKIGRAPIIYTGKYFWQDNVGNANVSTSPLWHAQYTSASCPDIASAWSNWAIWQYSSSGSVAGISGAVDMDRFNGTLSDLMAFINPTPCGTIGADGGSIDDGDACFVAGGPAAYLRSVKTAGQGGDLIWTHATASAAEANFATWSLNFAAAGKYRIEVYTAHAYAQSTKAAYVVTAGGAKHTYKLNQAAADGWQPLAEVTFATGGNQSIHLGDNTGEASASNKQLVFDAIRFVPVDAGGDDRSLTNDDGSNDDDDSDATTAGGCNAGGAGGAGLATILGFAGLAIRRRRA